MQKRSLEPVFRRQALALILLLAASLAGCSPPAPTPTALPTSEPIPTRRPTATPQPTPIMSPPGAPSTDPAKQVTLEVGKKIAIHASAPGADGYTWELQGDGKISATGGDAVLYSAPEQVVPGGTQALVIVTAYNKVGKSPKTSLIIAITAWEATSIQPNALDGIPAGWMSGGSSPADFIHLETGTNCHTGTDCLRFSYQSGGNWAGVYWWPLACGESGTQEAWAKVQSGTCAVNVLEAGKFSAVSRLTFWARGERGGEVVEFKIGGTDVLPLPGSSTGKVRLEAAWKQYEIDLKNMDMTKAVGLFAWIITDADNPQGAVFYLDDIQFKGMR